ncbi:unnamed protein product, partial [Mesorhabditis spiculigera]
MAKPNFDYVQYKADSPDSFLQGYLVRSDATKYFGCSAGQAEAKTIPADATELTYSWPPNYDTPTARYCNNQDFKLSLTAEDGMKAICIVISDYELETEKDYVRFWDASGSLRASLTAASLDRLDDCEDSAPALWVSFCGSLDMSVLKELHKTGFVVTAITVGKGNAFTVLIKDGDKTAFTITQANAAYQKDALKAYKSLNPYVSVVLQYNNDSDVTFIMNAYPSDLGTTPTAPPIVTVPPTGGAAGFLGVDLAFAFDSTGSVQDTFKTMRSVIQDAVDRLTVVQDVSHPYGARLSIQSISSAVQPNNLAVPWDLTKEEFLSILNSVPTRNPLSNYAPPVKAFLGDKGYFTNTTIDKADSRSNVQRIYAIFTQNEPNDLEDLKQILPKLVDRDVHLVVHWSYKVGTSNYCNNQNVTVLINGAKSDTTALCITVANYQLEIEKDYARFYDAMGTEVASLTGNNVLGAKFQMDGRTGSARLTTNEYLVYSGISFSVAETNTMPPKCF